MKKKKTREKDAREKNISDLDNAKVFGSYVKEETSLCFLIFFSAVDFQLYFVVFDDDKFVTNTEK